MSRPAGTIDSRLELWSVALFLLAFWSFNVLTATAYPFEHLDEGMFATPAIRYLAGKGFNIPFNEMASLYCFFLVPWIKLFGHSLRSVRAAEITWVTTGLFILWSAVKRLQFIEEPFYRILLLFLLATEYGMILSYRMGRYDGLGITLMAGTLWILSIQSQRKRLALLFVLFLFVPWAGLQFLPLELTAALTAFLIFRMRFWKEIVVSFVASGIGGLIFLAGLKISGRLPVFMELVHVQQRHFLVNLFHGVFEHHNAIPANYSLPFTFCAVVALALAPATPEFQNARLILRFALLFTVCLVGVLLVTSKFPTYYSYMVVIPLMIGLCAGLAICKSKPIFAAAVTLCAVAAIIGVGVHFYNYIYNRQDRDNARLVQFVNATIRPDDVVFVEPTAYLEVVGIAREAYMPTADWDIIERMSPEQRNSVNVLLMHNFWAVEVTQEFGGNWKPTGEELKSKGHNRFDKLNLGFLTIPDNDLLVYRR